MARGAFAAGLCLAAGCYRPPSACGISCTTECPGDLVCTRGVCVAEGSVCPGLELRAIGVGSRHVCGLDFAGQLYCWGDNRSGQVGTMTADIALAAPTAVGADVWTALAVGAEHSCGLRGGAVACWGDNEFGQATGAQGAATAPQPVQFPAGAPAVFDQIVAGRTHSCAIGGGQLWCWGDVPGGIDGARTPVQIGTTADWTLVSAGYDHTCGVNASQGFVCWGRNDVGQTGQPIGGEITEPTPVALPAGLVVSVVEAGDGGSCVIASPGGSGPGQLLCWGYATTHLFDDSEEHNPVPTLLPGDDWTAIAAGPAANCGIRGGRARCWGRTSSGGLGGGLWSVVVGPGEPIDLGAADAVEVALTSAGDFTGETGCMIAGATASCWGDNAWGELGFGVTALQLSPVAVKPPSGTTWEQLAGGFNHVCATTKDRRLLCWGADDQGQITAIGGRGLDRPCQPGGCDAPRPVAAPAVIATVDEMSAGSEFTCARSGDSIRCWGLDDFQGFLGGAPRADGLSVVNAPGGAWAQLLGGERATCGVTDDGRITCWGDLGPLGTQAELDRLVVAELGDVGFGDEVSCVIDRGSASRVCWGSASGGQLGAGPGAVDLPTPTVIPGSPVTRLALGGAHGCAITDLGRVECWGSNGFGESGVADSNVIDTPSVVNAANGPLAGCTAVATAGQHSCAVCAGVVSCWGRDDRGQTGRGFDSRSAAHVAVPIDARPGAVFVEVATYQRGGCALDADGGLVCWGEGIRGQNGDGGAGSNLPITVGAAR